MTTDHTCLILALMEAMGLAQQAAAAAAAGFNGDGAVTSGGLNGSAGTSGTG